MLRGSQLLIVVLLACCAPRRAQQTLYFPDGTRRWQVELKDGALSGSSTTWHSNGEIATTGHYQYSKEDGLFTYFDETGKITGKRFYRAGQLLWSGLALEEPPRSLVGSVEAVEAADNSNERPVTFVTLAPDVTQSSASIRSGYHRQDRGARSTDLAVSWTHRGAIVLASLGHSAVGGEMKPSGSKSWAALGGGYRILDSDEYRVAIVSKLALPISGDDIGGFAAASRTNSHRLSESAGSEPNSAWAQFMATARRTKGSRTTRIDVALLPIWSTSGAEPSATDDFQIVAHLGAAVGLAVGDYSLSVELTAASKLHGALAGIPVSGSAGFGASYDKWIIRPNAAVSVPVDVSLGDVVVFLLGANVPLEAIAND